MAGQGDDPVVRDARSRIDAVDDRILDLVNERVAIVAKLHEHKRLQGYDTVDPARERDLLERLVARNRGPISLDGLREVFRAIVEVTKREVPELPVSKAG